MTEPLTAFSPQDALIAIMVAVSVADHDIATAELVSIERIVNHLPAFAEYDMARVQRVAQTVFDLFEDEDGIDALFGLVRPTLPREFNETAYALACDIVAADGRSPQSELRMLEEIRHELEVDRLHAAAIERGARVRHLRL